jgi:hypothetical protein
MKKYTNKDLSKMNSNRFVVDVLRDEVRGRDAYQPITKKLRESVAYLHLMEETGIPYSLLSEIFTVWESKNPTKHLWALIVFNEKSFTEPLGLIQRAFVVNSKCKRFNPNDPDNSIYGDCLDGCGKLRLDACMAAEKGGKQGWQVEACYLLPADYCFPATFI